MKPEAIQANRYLEVNEIQEHLLNVEYIIMAAPAPDNFKDTPIHFSIFLNTADDMPQEIQEAVLEKFLAENGIGRPKELLSKIMPVGFAQTGQETHMPMLLIKPQDVSSIPNVPMFVMDFLADSDNFKEAKVQSLTGWSYSYN